jgi:glycosyltransferase involved in cell wall biosynthesis
MKKVLHFITGAERGGGAEKMLLGVLPFLKSAEHAACVLKGRGEIGRRLEDAGVKVFYLEMKGVWDVGVIGRYKNILQSFSPDVQVNYLIHADIFGRVFAKKFGVKRLISYIRNRHIKIIFRLFDFLTLPAVDYLLTNSRAVLDFYRRKYKFPEEKSSFITNGISLPLAGFSEYEKTELEKEFLIDKNDFILLSIARLHKQKDLPTLLRAAAEIKKSGFRPFKLLLCGTGKERKKLEKLAEKLGLSANIIFAGVRKNISVVLGIADIFILPSLHEGMSNALLEAMAAGKPCVVSAIPENLELIKNGKNGLCFYPRNFFDLAEKIKIIAAAPSSAAALGEKAREDVADYDLKKIIKRLDDFFQNIFSE